MEDDGIWPHERMIAVLHSLYPNVARPDVEHAVYSGFKRMNNLCKQWEADHTAAEALIESTSRRTK